MTAHQWSGPDGCQLGDRTVASWRSRDGRRWLLRRFDRLRSTPVSEVSAVSTEDLARHRAEVTAAGADLLGRHASFSVWGAAVLTQAGADQIAAAGAERRAAFGSEPMRWST
jgi:hypothetical protein